jgi:glycosyltransferase involved in cell wall biosynthesis
MATSSHSPPDFKTRAPKVLARDKPRLLAALYGNPDFHPPTLNGLRLMAQSFAVRILCRNEDGPEAPWPAAVERENVGEFRSRAERAAAGPNRKLADFTGFVRRLRAAIDEYRPALIYAYDPLAFAAAIRARRFRRDLPVVFHCHDVPPVERIEPTSLQWWLIRYALRRTRAAAFTVFPEKYRAAHWLAHAGDPRPAMVVPNGAARGFYPARADWNKLIARRFGNRRALYIGSIGEGNGQREAIRALAALPENVTLDLVGFVEPGFRDQLLALAGSLGLRDRVAVDAWVPHAERVRRAEEASLGLVLYHPINWNWEYSGSAPNKLFEYAAFGLPVIVPDRASYREFLAADEWVVYANPADPSSSARAIEYTLADPERYAAMSLAARTAHERKYNYEELFAPVLERLCALARTRSA